MRVFYSLTWNRQRETIMKKSTDSLKLAALVRRAVPYYCEDCQSLLKRSWHICGREVSPKVRPSTAEERAEYARKVMR
jgi:hypothetical protein